MSAAIEVSHLSFARSVSLIQYNIRKEQQQ